MLVGGHSTRFGTDKAAAVLHGRTLLEHQLQTLRLANATALAYIGGPPRQDSASDVIHIPDSFAALSSQHTDNTSVAESPHGPLVGIIAALAYAQTRHIEKVVVLACDVPLVKPSTITRLVTALHDAEIAVATTDTPQWTIAALRGDCCAALRTAYLDGHRALHRAFAPPTISRVAMVPIDAQESLNANDGATLIAIAESMTMDG